VCDLLDSISEISIQEISVVALSVLLEPHEGPGRGGLAGR